MQQAKALMQQWCYSLRDRELNLDELNHEIVEGIESVVDAVKHTGRKQQSWTQPNSG